MIQVVVVVQVPPQQAKMVVLDYLQVSQVAL
jgi:hypothetical protein